MQKKYKVFLVIIVVLILMLGGLSIYMKFFRNATADTNKSSVVENIEKFGYTLDDRDTKLMQDEFNNLKDILASGEIDYLKYAESISKLFVIDLYTIDNKINKYDVGSLEYILDSEKDKFKNIIIDSIYSNVEDDSNHKREQELPIVKEVVVDNILESTFLIGEETFDSIEVELSWEYVRDLGYDYQAKIVLIKDDEKLWVVEYTPAYLEEEVSE